MKNKLTIKLKQTNERPQNIRCGPDQVEYHTILASGFPFHIPNQMDAGERKTKSVSHIGVGADMVQVIEILINPKPHDQRGLSTFQQPNNNKQKMI